MTPTALRQFWSLVETCQTQALLELEDSKLTAWLMGQLQRQGRSSVALSGEDLRALEAYIQTHLHLIREIAESRYRPECNWMTVAYL
jgi:succinate dehydrogenase flavin-adding protein (antitoxin of CptAB toxin-antitoxin module)